MYMIKRFHALLLAIVLILSVLPVMAEPAAELAPAFDATVSEIQKYGNLVLDAKASDLFNAGFAYGDLVDVTVNAHQRGCHRAGGRKHRDGSAGRLL